MANWTIVKEKQRGKEVLTVRKGRERLPLRRYRHLRDNPAELKLFLLRLNESGRKRVEIRHAFISPAMQHEYLELLCTQKVNQTSARCEYNYVRKYFLGFFVESENLVDPASWHAIQKTKWAKFLLSPDAPKSMSTKKQIVCAANKFMKWLHQQRHLELPLFKFEPFDQSLIKQLEYDEKHRETRLVDEKHYKEFITKVDPRILPIVKLCYHFGLRRNEALGLKPEDVRNDHLFIQRQLIRIGVYGPPKGRKSRKIPYWEASAKEAYRWIISMPIMHPRTFSNLWDDAIALLKDPIPYNPHDLKHTWITRMIRLHEPRDVQLAAGHVSIDTTMGYLKDDRELGHEVFDPKSA